MSENPRIYSGEYYRRIFELEEKHWWYLGMREIARRMIESYFGRCSKLRILDAGCGTGMMLSWLTNYSSNKGVTGIDVSFFAVRFCKKRQLCKLALASVIQLPFRSGLFDLVVCDDVIQHLPKDGGDVRALAEIYRILKPGGALFLRSNARRKKEAHRNLIDSDFHKYTLSEIKEKISRLGFCIQHLTYANFLLSIYGEMKNRLNASNHSLKYQGFSVKMPPFLWLNTVLFKLLRAEAWYLSVPKRRLPFGHTSICFAVKPNQ